TRKYLNISESDCIGETRSTINIPLTKINKTSGKLSAEKSISSSLELVLLAKRSTLKKTNFLIANRMLTHTKYTTGAYIKAGIVMLKRVISSIISLF
ncbi:MAG: hypothetical protein KKB46_00695, partial [Candidatus Omnitrophica bacterium]|nr:hypothetical protein [Candidatus Omnitrophota bacterium]